jgi:hypothetical protein
LLLILQGKSNKQKQLGNRYYKKMTNLTEKYREQQSRVCTYVNVCYIAKAMDCFGYKLDCPLYRKSNGQFVSEARFHEVVDQLINKTKAKHLGLL